MTTTIDSVESSKTVSAVMTVAETEHLRDLRVTYEKMVWKMVVDNKNAFTHAKISNIDRERVLAQYALLAESLAKSSSENLYLAATYGIAAIENGMWGLAERISKDVRFAASTSAALGEVVRGLVGFIIVLIFLVYGTATLLIFLPGPIPIDIPNMFASNMDIIIGTSFGFLGGIVSLLLRLPEFEVMRGRSRRFLYLTGFTQPIVGGIFAAVISALFASHVVSFSLSGSEQGSPSVRLYFLIGFLSGFSERFSRTLLTSMETRITASLDKNGKAGRFSAEAVRHEVLREKHTKTDPQTAEQDGANGNTDSSKRTVTTEDEQKAS